MSVPFHLPDAGCYRRVRGMRVQCSEEGGRALCDYPLRVVRLSTVAARLLAFCDEQRSAEELAQHMQLPLKRVQALCEQLCRRGLLEAGPPLPPTTWPCVSILIPSRNRAEQLERCLRSLLALHYPADKLEIIVVDDASTDQTPTMLQRFAEETNAHGWQIRVLRHSSQQGVGNGRNTGAAAASHDLLAYIDSDCVASPGWLQELVPAFQDARTAAVGGLLRAYERTSMLGRYEDVRSSLFMGLRTQEVQLAGPLTYVPTANLLLRRQAWQQLGGFKPLNFGEDVDLCRRLLAADHLIRYLPYGTVYHDYRTRLRDFLRTRAAYASSEAVLLQLHPTERRTLLLPPEQASFASLAITGLWGIMWNAIQGSEEASSHPLADGISVGASGERMSGEGPCGRPRPLSNGPWHKQADTHTLPGPCGRPRALSNGHAFVSGWLRRATTRALPTTTTLRSPLRESLRLASIGRNTSRPYVFIVMALIVALFGAYRRWQKVREQRIPVEPFAVLRATMRGHLAYTYHLCRHLTRYYTLPMLLLGLFLPPLLLLALMLCTIVIGVDYVRLRPAMSIGEYALCSLLDDCAYGFGVAQGCIKQRTWRPLVPVIKRKLE